MPVLPADIMTLFICFAQVFSPGVWMRRWSADVARRLRLNQQLATRSAKGPESALLRGLVRCGLCGGTMHANRLPSLTGI